MQQTAQASPLMDRSGHGGGSNGGRLAVQDRLLKKPSLDTAIERFLRHQRHHLSNQLPDMEMENNRRCSGFIYDNSVNSILGSCSNNNGIRDTWLGFVNGLDLEESLKKKTDDQDVMGSSKDELSGSSSTRLMRPKRKQPKKDQSNGLIVKGQWTQDEDRVLISLVMEYGDRNWSEVAKQLNGRVGKQCRERWNNHLRPNVKKDRWSEEEERQLIEAHEKLGNKWSEIAKYIPGRTENTIKNHWNAARRRRNSRRNKKNRSASISTVLDDYIKANNLNVSGRSNPTTTTTASARGSAAAGNSAPSTTTSTEVTQQEDTEFATDSLHELSQFTSYEDEVMFMQSYFNVPATTLSYPPLPAFQQIPASEGGFQQMGYGGSSGYI